MERQDTKDAHEGGVALLQNLVGRGGPRVDAAEPEEDVLADLFRWSCLCVHMCVNLGLRWFVGGCVCAI
jgi:hypothetical protein